MPSSGGDTYLRRPWTTSDPPTRSRTVAYSPEAPGGSGEGTAGEPGGGHQRYAGAVREVDVGWRVQDHQIGLGAGGEDADVVAVQGRRSTRRRGVDGLGRCH